MPVVVNNVIKAAEDTDLRTTKAAVILEEGEISEIARYEIRSTRYGTHFLIY